MDFWLDKKTDFHLPAAQLHVFGTNVTVIRHIFHVFSYPAESKMFFINLSHFSIFIFAWNESSHFQHPANSFAPIFAAIHSAKLCSLDSFKELANNDKVEFFHTVK